MTSPGRISSIGPPSACAQPSPDVTISVWPSGCVCHALRAPGSNVTCPPDTRAGSPDWNIGSTRTAPVRPGADAEEGGIRQEQVCPWHVDERMAVVSIWMHPHTPPDEHLPARNEHAMPVSDDRLVVEHMLHHVEAEENICRCRVQRNRVGATDDERDTLAEAEGDHGLASTGHDPLREIHANDRGRSQFEDDSRQPARSATEIDDASTLNFRRVEVGRVLSLESRVSPARVFGGRRIGRMILHLLPQPTTGQLIEDLFHRVLHSPAPLGSASSH